MKPKTREACFLCPLATSTRSGLYSRWSDSPASCWQLHGRCFCQQRERHPPPPGWTTPPPYPLSEPTVHQEPADCAEGGPMPAISRAQTLPRLSPGLPQAPGSCEMHSRAADLWLSPSALLHQGHLRDQRKGCTTSKAMALGPQWPGKLPLNSERAARSLDALPLQAFSWLNL